MKWSDAKPTRGGWYWAVAEGESTPEVVCVEWYAYGKKWEVWAKEMDYALQVSDFFKWCGPIPEPEEA